MTTQAIPVELGARRYDVHVGANLLAGLGAFARQALDLGGDAPPRRAVVLADATVAPLYAQSVVASLLEADFATRQLTVPAGEPNKTLTTYASLMDGLLRLTPPIDRRTLIVALGGGVTSDIAGFVAATALRGLDWLVCPTTLLAAVDASVGGKTAVDHPAGKNLVGAFHQPRGVLIDVNTFATLPHPQFVDGLAECVKHAVIRDRALLEFMEDHTAAIIQRDEETLVELVARNVAIKAEIVAGDEREAGDRALLNFGHTIGHAVETLVGYERIGHGAAVSLGMTAACELARSRGLLEREACQRVTKLLATLGLPTKFDDLENVPRPTTTDIWNVMQRDKKTQAGQVRMILPVMLGAAAIFDDITPDNVARAVEVL
ncbi:MAG: 3-dehydroquinate synthase [Phycisphaerae bacterium]|nr:3-dehydroquinate synthase [Phycisphaerae bacterium]